MKNHKILSIWVGGRRCGPTNFSFLQTMHAWEIYKSRDYVFDMMVVYEEKTLVNHYNLWNSLDNIQSIFENSVWITVSGFNEIRFPTNCEELGAFDHVRASEFNNATKRLIELSTIGGPFRWCNGYALQHTDETRLCLVNDRWASKWSQVRPIILFGNSSDHAAILIELLPIEYSSKPFKFYNSRY